MSALIIGDFRGITLKQYQDKAKKINFNYSYLLDEAAELSWFNNTVIPQLPLRSLVNTNVVIALGFNDCAYSCVWKAFNISTIANSYAKAINELIEQYADTSFYVCSVNPVDADYPFAESDKGVITKDVLNKAIDNFNTILNTECKASFIDSYKYLSKTGFETRDSVRYKSDTCENILAYISCNLKNVTSSVFRPRLYAPTVDSEDSDSDTFWVSDKFIGGYNPFAASMQYGYSAGDTLPSSTAYVWGRFYEILHEPPTLKITNEIGSYVNPEQWYLDESDGYIRGQEPKLGAVICWRGGTTLELHGTDGIGHVAIVEQINSDGSIVTSESKSGDSRYWWTVTRTNTNNNWGEDPTKYTFQGFIYCSINTPSAAAVNVIKSQVTSHNNYLNADSEEQQTNAKYIWKFLGSRGWTLNAVAGLLGNMQHESTINPGLTEKGHSQGGFGLVQWTPKTDLTDWCSDTRYNNPVIDPNDIDSQLLCLDAEVTGFFKKGSDEKKVVQYFQKKKDSFNIPYPQIYAPKTFAQFKESSMSPYDLAVAFYYNYERAGVVLWGAHTRAEGAKLTTAEREAKRAEMRDKRGKAAEKWYKFLSSLTDIPDRTDLNIDFRLSENSNNKIAGYFISPYITNASYKLLDSSEKAKATGKFSSTKLSNAINLFSFTRNNILSPNTFYKILITAEDASKNTVTISKDFTTPQSRPAKISNIKLAINDDKLPSVSLKVSTELVKDWGYWKKNDHGYNIQLIVNGEVIEEITKTSIDKTWSFDLDKEFKSYKSKIGDIVQIGICTYVKDDKDKPIFSAQAATISNPICFIKQPTIVHLKR